jgi:tetratricopeptide (TPR) repeat protein
MGKQDQALNCLDEVIRVYKLFEDVISEKLSEIVELKGDTLSELKKYDKAISMFQECLHSIDLRDNEGIGHSYDERVARLNYKLGYALAKIGEYDEAFDSYREAVTIYSHVLGKSDLHVGEVMYDVGLLIVSQGGDNFCARALECFNEMVRIYGLKGKGRDVKVADALVQKSSLLAECTEYDEAGSLLDEAIDIYKESLDDDAVEIGKAMLVYGNLYDSQGKNNEAVVAFDEALRIFLMKLGDDDIHVSLALSKMGIIHARRLEFSEAVDKCKTALKIRVTRGEQDQDVADSVFNIGKILNDWGKEDEAFQYFQQALKLYIHLHGDGDISAAKCQQKLGEIYWNRKDIDQSLDSFLHALRVCEQEDDEDMKSMLASIYRGIGNCYYKKGEYDQALENFARCLRIQKKELGDDCIEMAPICDNIGLVYQQKERYEEAMNFHSKALLINENHYGKGAKECAPSDFQIARVVLASKKYEESIARLHNHMKLFYDESHDCEEVGEVYHSLGLAQSKLGEYEESVTSLNRALEMRTKLFGKSNLSVAETRLDLAKVLDESGNTDEVSL